MRQSSCEKGAPTANNSWSVAYSVQWTRRFDIREPTSRRSFNMAAYRVHSIVCQAFGYNFNSINRNSDHKRTISIYHCQGVCPSTTGSSDNISGFAIGMRSLGDRPRVGRAALPNILRMEEALN